MRPETNYYQITGYQAHSNGWFKKFDDKPLIAAIMGSQSKLLRPGGKDTPVELILGILPSGASYLLMTREQMLEFTHKHRLGIPRDSWEAADFLSLSPIHFDSQDELNAKIATYRQRRRNQNRREDGEKPVDNSQANRGYVKTGTSIVHYRGYFEHQRTLYRLLTRDLEPGKVGLAPPAWLNRVRVISLVLGEWTVDNRRRDERLNDPKLVDVGWTEAVFPSFFEQLTGSSVHLRLKATKLINPNSRKPHFSEVVEDDLVGLYARLRDLFSHDVQGNGVPLLVLVHDEQMARGVLARAGIDVDSWPSGLSNLLPLATVKVNDPPEPLILPGACLVDTQKLVTALMETASGLTIPHNAKILHMQTDVKICAGDDSLLQLRVWTSMAQGPAIDEQRKQRLSHEPDCAQVLAPPPTAAAAAERQQGHVDVDPNDADPNDMPPGPRPTIADDFSDDDDW